MLTLLPSVHMAYSFSEDKNWPCIQRKVITLSAGQMWPGIVLEKQDTSWKTNEKISKLIKSIFPRRVDLKQTAKIIDQFAVQQPTGSDKIYEQIFAGLLNETNSIRQEIISGIGRFAKRQQQLAERIKKTRRQVTELEKKDTAVTLTKLEDQQLTKLEQQLEWDQRIYEERELSMDYVCEAPVILSQRLFTLAKQLKKHHSTKAAEK